MKKKASRKKGKAAPKKKAAKKKSARKKTVRKATRKAGPPVHAVNWFEIPVLDFDRAGRFYSTILSIRALHPIDMNGMKMAFLPAANGGVGGALIAHSDYMPSEKGTLVYLNGGRDLSKALSKVESAGGRVVMPKTLITKEIGYMARFRDTEGNIVALHSPK